jgi:hypothetical protein
VSPFPAYCFSMGLSVAVLSQARVLGSVLLVLVLLFGPLILTRAVRSKPLLQAKWAKVYFCKANHIPCVEVHFRRLSCAASKAMQFTAVDLLYTSKLMSSANPKVDRYSSSRSSASSSSALQKRKKIGDSGDPCGTPASSCQGAVSPPSASTVFGCSVRNNRIVRTNQSGTCFFRKLSSGRKWFTVSNALKVSRDSTYATHCFELWKVCICPASSSKAVSVDPFCRFRI